MDSISDCSSAAILARYEDSTNSSSLSSCPSTPDIMDCDQSNNEARNSVLITESPAQEYVLPNHQDGIKLESNVPSQGFLGSEPSSKSPAQEHIFPKSQEGQESSVAMAVHRVINDDDRQTAAPFPRSPAFHPVNMVSEECSYNPQSGKESKERSPTAGRSDRQQPQPRKFDGLSNTAQTWDPSARKSLSVDDQRRVGQPVLDQGPGNDAPGATFNRVSHVGNVLPPLQMNTLPLPEMPDTHRNQEKRLPPIDNTSLPSIAELDDPPQVNRWRLRPKYQWSGVLPDIYETRRLELQAVDGQPPRLVQGPTQHLGPPLKPLDDARSEEVAREQWRRVMREREIHEAGGL